MNLWFHIIFGCFSLLFFLISFIKHKKLYHLLFGILMAGTFLIYISESQLYRMILGVFEIILCIAALTAMFRARRKAAKQ